MLCLGVSSGEDLGHLTTLAASAPLWDARDTELGPILESLRSENTSKIIESNH